MTAVDRGAWEGVVGTRRFEVVDDAGRAVSGPRVAVVGLTHGNETVGEAVLDALASAAPDHLRCGELLLVRNNLEAARLGTRHTPEGTDLNRLWDAGTLARLRRIGPSRRCYEHERALALAPLLMRCDAILDLHSASQPSPPFLVLRDDRAHARIGRALGVRRIVTGLHEDGILGGGMCPDVGLFLGQSSDRIGVTLEAGQHVDPANRARAREVARRFLVQLGLWRGDVGPPAERPLVYEVLDRVRQASGDAVPWRFVGHADGEPGGGRRSPPRPLASFQSVDAGEEVLRRGARGVFRAPTRFTMLLPTPTADPGTDLFYLALKRRDVAGAVEDAASGPPEAHAMEQLLDLLEDDEFSRGTTWVSFDARQTLDLGAELVARALRLPVGHPHRRITLVGRGDWGGGASERRFGRRLRRAVAKAMDDGLPFDRYQLLRGARMGWLEALTTPGQAARIAERVARRRERGQEGTGATLRLSVRQPPSLSLLVTGDVERGLAEGNTRHVRVALLLEAPSVVPDGSSVQVRTARLGLVSSRQEFVRTAAQLLTHLAREHDVLMTREPWSTALEEVSHRDPRGGLVLEPDPARLAALGAVLRRLQLREWRSALAPEVVQAARMPTHQLGSWLAGRMAHTGILDPYPLRALLVDEADGVVTVRPERLERTTTRHRRVVYRRGLMPFRPLEPPVSAADVTPDTLPRWVAWKRFVRGRSVVSGTRGSDVDLALAESAIHARLARWYEQLVVDGEREPGRWCAVLVGDGLVSAAEPGSPQAALLVAHDRLARAGSVRYLRVQHARGTHGRWWSALADALASRPDDGEPCGVHWESEHGSAVHVVWIGRLRDGVTATPWSLRGFEPVRAAVVVAELGPRARETRVALTTEPMPEADGTANPELLEVARNLCEGLLAQDAPRVWARRPSAAALRDLWFDQVGRWIRALRADFGHDTAAAIEAVDRLGLGDVRLARELVRAASTDAKPSAVAAAAWGPG